MEVYYDGGVVVQQESFKILLDPRRIPSFKPDVVVISHAHRDHYNLKVLRSFPEVPKIMSHATRHLIDKRKILKNVIEVSPGDQVDFHNFSTKVYNAGHVLGSLQVELVIGNKRVVFTGDFNLQARIILRPAEIIKSDILIIEATYGHPRYKFPSRVSVYRQILELIKNNLEEATIFGRHLGTAQELTALLAFSKIGVLPIVHPYIAKVNKIYEMYGENLGTYRVYQYEKSSNNGPVIMPLTGKIMRREPNSQSVVCTGWAAGIGKRNYVPLSSHADFEQIIQYIIESSAEKIYTVYGFSDFLANFLKHEYGIDAESIQ
ncbi:MAG TPA: MBL fold metallo-hydrolase [Thermoproteales archaeon]|nr:MBL fold metallo-hydrolase [Thermoproteales archaeon]